MFEITIVHMIEKIHKPARPVAAYALAFTVQGLTWVGAIYIQCLILKG